ncbi:hypothetical protein HWC26_gp154 [Aeromonas phage 2L372X]|uniref:Uncharacterized protein n=1 Tax=Aeromonas phage 2L372X TaxID=2588515 RepID=A0A5B9N700_9CAUD|nr:hypothetical protein HWC26_gp154 [Aeromonas phage 2L372X]QEG08406.1 hypothetical protein [Aeromonas phage 2L372X]
MKSKIKGLTMLVFIGIILVVAALVPSVSASESKAYTRYKLVSESVSGNYKTCVFRNSRGETKSTSVNKGKRCPSTY